MADDDTFTVTTTWQAVQANGADIRTGIFTIFNKKRMRVELLKASSLPNPEDDCSRFMDKQKDEQEYVIASNERLYARTRHGTAEIGVTEAG